METHILVLALGLGLTALLSWAAVARGDHVVELITRPTFHVLLGGLAWSLAQGAVPGAPDVRVVLVPLGLGLLADLLLITATGVRYAFALLVLLLMNAGWVWVVLSTDRVDGFPWWLLSALLVPALVHAQWGGDVVRYAGRQRGLVLLHTLSLVALLLVVAWQGDWVVILGGAMLLVGSTILGHDRFVLERRLAPALALIAWQAGQTLLVVGVFR